jgi:uncharacterized protein
MLYMILGQDTPDALPKRKATRPAHLDYVKALHQQGRVRLAGPRPKLDSAMPADAGFYGSLLIVEFATLQEAREWAANDPYTLAGVFEHVEVQPFIQVLPA